MVATSVGVRPVVQPVRCAVEAHEGVDRAQRVDDLDGEGVAEAGQVRGQAVHHLAGGQGVALRGQEHGLPAGVRVAGRELAVPSGGRWSGCRRWRSCVWPVSVEVGGGWRSPRSPGCPSARAGPGVKVAVNDRVRFVGRRAGSEGGGLGAVAAGGGRSGAGRSREGVVGDVRPGRRRATSGVEVPRWGRSAVALQRRQTSVRRCRVQPLSLA